jgi:hypothetical protein
MKTFNLPLLFEAAYRGSSAAARRGKRTAAQSSRALRMIIGFSGYRFRKLVPGSVDLTLESIFITSQVKLHPCLENIEDVVIGDAGP